MQVGGTIVEGSQTIEDALINGKFYDSNLASNHSFLHYYGKHEYLESRRRYFISDSKLYYSRLYYKSS